MQEKILKTAAALERNGFTVKCFETKEEALKAFLEETDPKDTVGIGGSITAREMGIPEALAARGTTVYQHWDRPEGKSVPECQREAMLADLYVASNNAVTEDGRMINIDGTGNRLSSMLFGHKRLYLMTGFNKIVANYEDGLIRIKNVACPPNAQRLGKKTPCAELGHCMNCDSPARMCNATLILERQITGMPITVYLINEKLGK
ncbi:MAG: lactate utilization protein [Firmicutes bacterium]|nr:lactate utilization protein [Bacillota bacterium]